MNFDFLNSVPQLGKLASYCNEAEMLLPVSPTSSVATARKALEYTARLIYGLKVGDSSALNLFEVLNDPTFVAFVNDEPTIDAMHAIRKMGNVAAHDGTMTFGQAQRVLEMLHFVVGDTCITLGAINDYPPFVRKSSAVPQAPAAVQQAAKPASSAKPATAAQVTKPKAEKIVVESKVIAEYSPRMRYTRFNVSADRDEDENKRLFLSASLREAGWPIVNMPNQAMPASAGIHCMLEDGKEIDYVLYGRDNRPLAIIDYSTMVDKGPIAARTRVEDAARKMSLTLGYKPIAYYTNGYRIYCIDQLGYKVRRVFDFHTIEELELLKQRATSRQDISDPPIRDEITNRDYQKNAIRSVCQAFMDGRRKSLIVMATGTGKTRVSISLADVLLKANWVKNILFLADRTSLVKQAHKSFNKLLPDVPTSVYTGGEGERDSNARIIFSTYQTMVNLIDDDSREFTIGRFDLIIIDEAHRSIFKKYGSIFKYFDALMVGLTATPRAEENKSTYDVFQLPAGEPDYAYELEEAIEDGYLVGFQVLDRTTDFLRRGIRYDDLSDEEKRKFEEAFDEVAYEEGDEEDEDDERGESKANFNGMVLRANKGGSRVINKGTINTMLGDLMKNGLKIDAGDKLGKTFIFAKSHKEAEIIVERFQAMYGHLGADFCKLIDSQVGDNQRLIEAFADRDKLPQVAVSVDMLDTGIDVPDALNLVFFKGVHSKIKFMQMVGRGTRLSPDVFGPGMDKQGFLVFDYYDNFRYFSTTGSWSMVDYGKGSKGIRITPQSVIVNTYKLRVLRQLDEGLSTTDFDLVYREELRREFIAEVQSLTNDDVQVQYDMALVSKWRTPERWHDISAKDEEEIVQHILPLIPAGKEPVRMRSFDALMYAIEASYMQRLAEGKDPLAIRHGFYNVGTQLSLRMEALLKLKTIPEVMQKKKLVASMLEGDYLMEEFSLERAEYVRKELRGLMQYIPDDRRYYVLDIADELLNGDGDGGGMERQKPYSQKAQEYLTTSGDPSLMKLRNLDELDSSEKEALNQVFTVQLGTQADYAAWSNNAPLLPYLRRQVGIADEAVVTKFGTFLNEQTLTKVQYDLMQQIVTYARTNGDVTFQDLLKTSPFSDIDFAGTFGPNIAYVQQLVNGLHRPVM